MVRGILVNGPCSDSFVMKLNYSMELFIEEIRKPNPRPADKIWTIRCVEKQSVVEPSCIDALRKAWQVV